MKEFLNVAKDLNIKEIGENVVDDDSNDDMRTSNSELIEESSTTNESGIHWMFELLKRQKQFLYKIQIRNT